MRKRENASNQHFLYFPQCFSLSLLRINGYHNFLHFPPCFLNHSKIPYTIKTSFELSYAIAWGLDNSKFFNNCKGQKRPFFLDSMAFLPHRPVFNEPEKEDI